MPSTNFAYPDPTVSKFLQQYETHPAVAIQEALKAEAHFRHLFAQHPDHESVANPYVSLIKIFDHPILWRQQDMSSQSKHEIVMPLDEEKRRAAGECAITPGGINGFRRNWKIFTENILENINWNNVFAAGGAVNACLLPIPEEYNNSNTNIRKYYHEQVYKSSDIDLFIYGLDEEQAKAKMEEIYQTVCDSIPWEVTCVRSKNVITLVSQYPYRYIQIILRLYHSPAEVLMGFDVDCCSVGYDGQNVWVLPRAQNALVRQQNTVDMTRRSPSYEMRLAKYSERGFEIFVPGLERDRIDPTIFERGIEKLRGLARLLMLERLKTPEERFTFLERRREQRNRPRHKNAGAYAATRRDDDLRASSFENNDYETVHLPYGPKWNAKRIVKQLYTKDMILNSPWYTKNRGKNIKFHRHPCFFGTMKEVMEDCCGYCPDIEQLEPEQRPTEAEAELYIQGPISFIKDDPGRQAIGSFHPITSDDWAVDAYIEQPREDICSAAPRGDVARIKQLITEALDRIDMDMQIVTTDNTGTAMSNRPAVTPEEAINEIVNVRDPVGRTPLQLAVMGDHEEAVRVLLEHGARICARVSDGRTVLHLAAQNGDVAIVRLLLEQNEKNKAAKELREAAQKDDSDVDMSDTSSMDIINMDDLADYPGNVDWDDAHDANENAEEIDDDIMDLNITDWDYQLSAAEHAIILGHFEVVKLLIEAGADPRRVIKIKRKYEKKVYYPLTLCMSTTDCNVGLKIAHYLITKGARPTQLDLNNSSVFFIAVKNGYVEFVRLFLKLDAKLRKMINMPDASNMTPLYYAVENNQKEMVQLLLKCGAKVDLSIKDCQAIIRQRQRYNQHVQNDPLALSRAIRSPVMAGLENGLYKLLMNHSVNLEKCYQESGYRKEKRTALDEAEALIRGYEKKLEDLKTKQPSISDIDEYRKKMKALAYEKLNTCAKGSYEEFYWDNYYYSIYDRPESMPKQVKSHPDIKEYEEKIRNLKEACEILLKHGAKRYIELFPEEKEEQLECRAYHESYNTYYSRSYRTHRASAKEAVLPEIIYFSAPFTKDYEKRSPVPKSRHDEYLKLFNAVWNNDRTTVEKLTRPSSGVESTKLLHIGVTDGAGHSLLSIACLRGHVEMAQLILRIADEQFEEYVDTKEKTNKTGKQINNYRLHQSIREHASDDDELEDSHNNEDSGSIATEDDDNESDDSGGSGYISSLVTLSESSDDDDEEEDLELRDRDISEVSEPEMHNYMPPHHLLTLSQRVYWSDILKDCQSEVLPELMAKKNTKISQVFLTVLQIAVVRNDLDMVRALVDSTKSLKNGLGEEERVKGDDVYHLLRKERVSEYFKPNHYSISLALCLSHVEIVDFLLRESVGGDGFSSFDIYRDNKDFDPETKLNKKTHYLGLNVNGKKRKSWVNQHNPNARSDTDPVLLHLAIRNSSIRSIEYLLSNRPMEALAYFASTHTDDLRTTVLRKDKELRQVAQCILRLGSKTTTSPFRLATELRRPKAIRAIAQYYKPDISVIDSPTLSDLLNAKLDDESPALYYAVSKGYKDCVDELLAAGADPLCRYKGWNILHIAVNTKNLTMVRHLHKVLPAETWRRLMSMCTRTYRYTPLAMAVSTGDADMLKLLLELLPDTDILDIKDACCNHVLHISARNGYAEVTNLLLEELVKRDHLSVLQNEDGSGLLPLEIARQMAVGRFFKYGINTCIRDEKEQEKEAKERAERLAKGESSWAKHTDVNKVLALIQTASANLSTPLPRHTIQLKELHQMVFEAAKDAHRLAKIPYYRRDSMSNPNSPPDDSSRNVGTQF